MTTGATVTPVGRFSAEIVTSPSNPPRSICTGNVLTPFARTSTSFEAATATCGSGGGTGGGGGSSGGISPGG